MSKPFNFKSGPVNVVIHLCYIGMALLCLPGCGAYSAAGMVGSTMIRTIDNQSERDELEEPQRLEIARTNFMVGAEYIRLGNYEKAQQRLNKSIAVKPDYAPAYDALGVLYQAMGEAEQAEKNFKHSLKLDKGNPATMNNYGQFLCGQGRMDEAQALFNTAAAKPLYRTPEIALTNAGSCALMNDEQQQAVAYFERALQLNPGVAQALYAMADIEYGKQNYFAANSYLKRYLEVARHNPQTLWLGIRLQRILGDKDLLASYTLLLRNQFSDSEEAKLLSAAAPRDAASSLFPSAELIHDLEFLAAAVLLSAMDLLSGSSD